MGIYQNCVSKRSCDPNKCMNLTQNDKYLPHAFGIAHTQRARTVYAFQVQIDDLFISTVTTHTPYVPFYIHANWNSI